MADKIFAEGLYFNDPRDGAPEFIVGSLAVLKDKFSAWLSRQEVDHKGYVKLDVKRGREGNIYVELNTWKPDNNSQRSRPMENDDLDDDIPF